MTLVASKTSFACVVITKNEEANIRDCLESIRWADELIVVDAESRDCTVELVRTSWAKVWVRPWPGFGRTHCLCVCRMCTFVKYAKQWDATRQVVSHPEVS